MFDSQARISWVGPGSMGAFVNRAHQQLSPAIGGPVADLGLTKGSTRVNGIAKRWAMRLATRTRVLASLRGLRRAVHRVRTLVRISCG